MSIDNNTATSMRVSWKNLSALLSQSILHYITVIKSSNGSIVNGNILQGNATSNVFYGLSPYMEYRLNVFGVNDNKKVYKSSEVTEWTEESGMFITLSAQLCYRLPLKGHFRVRCRKPLFQGEAKWETARSLIVTCANKLYTL